MAVEEGGELAEVAAIGFERLGREPALMGEMAEPVAAQGVEIGHGAARVMVGLDPTISSCRSCSSRDARVKPEHDAPALTGRESMLDTAAMSERPDSAAEEGGTVDVLIPLGLDQAYSYAVPPGLALAPGDVVQVPLGPRETVGVVWSRGNGRGGNLKKVTGRLDMPPLDPALMKLVDWVAWYTLAPKGSVLALVLRRPPDETPERPKLGVRLVGAAPARMTPARARAHRGGRGRAADREIGAGGGGLGQRGGDRLAGRCRHLRGRGPAARRSRGPARPRPCRTSAFRGAGRGGGGARRFGAGGRLSA